VNPTLTKSFTAGAAVAKRRIVKHGASAGQAIQAAAVGDAMFGVSGDLDAASGDPVDVHVAGIPEVEYGAAVAAGDPITSDAVGRAVKAAPIAGVNNNVIGHAMVPGVIGDIGSVIIAAGSLQG